jgi:TonB family protein
MSEKNTPTPQEPTATKKKSLVPTALILGLAGVGAYGIYTGSVTDWVGQGIDKVGNPTELFASSSSELEPTERRNGGTPNLFPDDYEPTYSDTEATGYDVPSPDHRADTSATPLALDEAPGNAVEESPETVTGNSRYLDDLSRGSSQEPYYGGAGDEAADAGGATDDYQLDFGGGRSTAGDDTAEVMTTVATSPSEHQEPDEPSASIPEPEEMEAELARIMSERDTPTAIEGGEAGDSIPAASGEIEVLSPEERQQIIESPEFTDTIVAIGRRVGQSWRYEGDDYAEHGAIVKVHLENAGETADITISRSSGNDAYDASVLAAAQASAPFKEVLGLDKTAQTLLTEFSLTFGSREAIEKWEAQWSVHEQARIAAENAIGQDLSYVSQVRRMIEAEWDRPDSFDADSEVSVQVRLAVPFGNVLAINYLRPSDDEAINDSISDAIRSASPFDGIRQLSLKEQQELQQFNLHFRAEGIR